MATLTLTSANFATNVGLLYGMVQAQKKVSIQIGQQTDGRETETPADKKAHRQAVTDFKAGKNFISAEAYMRKR